MRAGIETPLPVTVLFTSDEEVGLPSTRDLIEAEAEASRHAAVLVPEPGGPGHEVTTGRYAIARFAIETTGRPSHAGAQLSEGRSAIRAMTQRIIEIEDMTTEDCTFSVGVIRGGEWVNCVASTCTAQVLSMAKRQTDLDRGVERMLALAGHGNDVRFEVTRTVTRPVWEPDVRTLALYAQAEALAKPIGIPLPHRSAGGVDRRFGRQLHRGVGAADPGWARGARGWRAYAGGAPAGGQPSPTGTAAGGPARDLYEFVAAAGAGADAGLHASAAQRRCIIGRSSAG